MARFEDPQDTIKSILRPGNVSAGEALPTDPGLFDNMIRLLPDPIFFKNLDGSYQRCNAAFEQLLGKERAEIVDKTDYDLFLPSIAHVNRHNDICLLNAGLPSHRYETSIVSRNGRRREVIIQIALITIEGGPTGIFGIIKDITERRRAETALRERKDLLHRITDNMLDLVSEADQHGFFRYLSPSHGMVLGFAPEELVGTWLYDLMHPDDLERMRITFRDTLPALKIVRAEFRYRHADGHYLWLETIAKCTTDELNRVNGAVFASRDVTERVRAEKALRNNEEQLRRITDHMPALVSAADLDGLFTYLSPSHRGILGFDYEALIGTCLWDWMHPDDMERMRKAFQVTLPEKKRVHEEFRYRHVDGHYIWLETVAKCTMEGLRVTGSIFASRDITERRRAEIALREVNQTLQATIQASPLAIFVLNREGCIQLWNPAARQMFGWTEEEVKGKYYRLAPDYLDLEFRQNLARMNRGEKFHGQETKRRCKDGTLLDISFSTAPLYDQKGRIIGTVGILEDITERKRTEVALRESEELFRQIFEQNEDPAFLFDPDTLAILDANAVAVRLYGYSKKALRAGGLNLIMKPVVLTSFARKLVKEQAGLADDAPWRHVSPLNTIASSGKEVMASFRGRLLRSRGQVYFYGTFRDITEKLRIRKERSEMQAKLIQANKMTAIGTLASGIAHEINNPNNYLLANAQFLEEAWPDIQHTLQEHADSDPDLTIGGLPVQEALKDIPQLLQSLIEGSRRIKNIVTSLKDFSRQDDESTRRPVDINRVINAALVILANKIKKSTDLFNCTLSAGLPPIMGHSQKIEQVIINLLINALQALPHRQAGVSLTTSLQESPRSVVIKIRDQGTGIPEEIRGRILDPFFTTKHKTGGTGLGLSICYAIINDHKGSIDFASEAGAGTTVTVVLPVL
ncbi:sensor histidine kinase, PAS, PAS, PAS, PAS and sensory_box domain-containing [Syntrophotalea carbinolica DSM 2380]|uniref:histidine kinase n=1 Tax=Syntrophotalea carbinolica (strain DSM 2380 / NBRC 103641 / GraBd1) TaxID=338963 RepID=Q3A0L8_SYNC1|nr:PAS domain-containing sensor histidine kinase [Syntrophotalea carbinolica]ABA90089.1 sensor histidine kinase, PAS, PAS, PAS, PAS and sensory_box domain-containing [Syntrophotalea carbinolica DSM 2380]